MNILKCKPEDEDTPHPHRVPLDLSDADHELLMSMVRHTKTSKADVLRQCINYVHARQFGDK